MLDCIEHVAHIFKKWQPHQYPSLVSALAATREVVSLKELRVVAKQLIPLRRQGRLDCRFVIHALEWAVLPVKSEEDIYDGFAFAVQKCASAIYFSDWQNQKRLKDAEEAWQLCLFKETFPQEV